MLLLLNLLSKSMKMIYFVIKFEKQVFFENVYSLKIYIVIQLLWNFIFGSRSRKI